MSFTTSAPPSPTATATASEPLVLELLAGENGPERFALPEGPTSIGSGRRCTIRLSSPGVGPLHCVISRGAGGVVVRRWSADTTLNGEDFQESTLHEGDRLTIASVDLVVATSPANEAPALDEHKKLETSSDAPIPSDSVPDDRDPVESDCDGEANDPADDRVDVESTPSETPAEAPAQPTDSAAASHAAAAPFPVFAGAPQPLPAVPAHLLNPLGQKQKTDDRKAPACESGADQLVPAASANAADVAVDQADADQTDAEPQGFDGRYAKGRLHRLVAALRGERRQLESLRGELAEAVCEATCLASELNGARGELAEASRTSLGFQRELSEAVDQLADAGREAHSAESDLGGQQQRVEELEAEVLRLEGELAAQTDKVVAYDQRVSEFEAAVAQLESPSLAESVEAAPTADQEPVASAPWPVESAADIESSADAPAPPSTPAPGSPPEPTNDDLWSNVTVETPADEPAVASPEPSTGDAPVADEPVADESVAGLWDEPAPVPDAAEDPAAGPPAIEPPAAPAAAASDLWDIESTPSAAATPPTEPPNEPVEAAPNAIPNTAEAWLASFASEADASGNEVSTSEAAPDDESVDPPTVNEPASDDASLQSFAAEALAADPASPVDEEVVVANLVAANAAAEPAEPVVEPIPEPASEQAAVEASANELSEEPPAEPVDSFTSDPADDQPVDADFLESLTLGASPVEQPGFAETPSLAGDESDSELASPPLGATLLRDAASDPPQTADDLIPSDQPQAAAPTSFIEKYASSLPADEPDQAGVNPFDTPSVEGPSPSSAFSDPASGLGSSDDGAEDGSIEDYMAGLMERIRGEADGPSVTPPPKPAAPAPSPTPQPAAAPVSDPVGVLEDVAPEPPLSPITSLEDLRSGPAPEQGRDMSALRELANSSARSAIGAAAKKQNSEKAFANLAISGIAMGCGGFLAATAPSLLNGQFLGGVAGFGWAGYWGWQTLQHILAAKRAEAQIGARVSAAADKEPLPIE